jgi:hypothetical protein
VYDVSGNQGKSGLSFSFHANSSFTQNWNMNDDTIYIAWHKLAFQALRIAP